MSMLHYLHLLELRNEDARTKNISLSNHIFYLDCWLSINIWTLGGNLVLLVDLSWHLRFPISGREALLW
jgi:hypothetical protein